MWILLIIQISFAAVAADSVTTAIEEAHALALKRDRQKACSTLRDTLKATPSSNKSSRARLIEALDQMDKVFFSDKGQKEFEAGQSLMFENPDLALGKLQAALSMEDDNLAVLNTLAKVQLFKQDCNAAEASVARARALNPQAMEPMLLNLRVLVCKKKHSEFSEMMKALPPLRGWEEQFVNYTLGVTFLEQKSPRKAFEVLTKVTEGQPNFPEAYFYLARVGQQLNKDNTPWLQKYVSLCKVASAKDRKKFSLEPRLCVGLKDAENELSKKVNDI